MQYPVQMQTQLKIHPRVKNNEVHTITHVNGDVTIHRIKPPLLKVYYNPHTQSGNLLSCPSITKERFTDKQIESAVKKAIAFAKHNIRV